MFGFGFYCGCVCLFSFLLILEPGLVWVGLGWDSGWDCARVGFSHTEREHFTSLVPVPGPPLNSRARAELEEIVVFVLSSKFR